MVLNENAAHNNLSKALEWIPYNRFYDIKVITKDEFGKIYRAKWIDRYIDEWDNEQKNWKRKGPNMFVITVPHKIYGITQNPKTKNYKIDLSKALEWIPYNKLYNKLYNIEYISKDGFDNKVYRARWINGHIDEWNDKQQNWKRKDQNMSVILKRLCDSTDIMLEFTINEIITAPCKVYGITQNPETKNHMIVLNEM
ncbi:kinase-like domain-containing protein [Rhizophagus clarus]|uniref:Kinase-like domain-containing protein n=1 Tax=Rhizophagus clarus TaxID=94130 RepID=A0A8H3L1V5_9GLOM|nr:kinase-like domain-containing protein [Rhizophagus clarus]